MQKQVGVVVVLSHGTSTPVRRAFTEGVQYRAIMNGWKCPNPHAEPLHFVSESLARTGLIEKAVEPYARLRVQTEDGALYPCPVFTIKECSPQTPSDGHGYVIEGPRIRVYDKEYMCTCCMNDTENDGNDKIAIRDSNGNGTCLKCFNAHALEAFKRGEFRIQNVNNSAITYNSLHGCKTQVK